MLKLGDITSIQVLAFIFIMILTLILFLKNIPGSFLISIIVGTIFCIKLGIVETQGISYTMPNFNEYSNILFKLDFSGINTIKFWLEHFH